MTTPLIVCVGLATIDTIALVPRYPRRNDRVEAREIRVAGGGPAATAAVTAARLGTRVAFIGRVGADAYGRRILDDLSAHGVDVRGVTTDELYASAISTIVVDETTGDRSICTTPQSPLELSSRAQALLKQADWIHVDHIGWPAIAGQRELGAAVSVDAGNPLESLDLTQVDLYVPTVSALQARYGDQTVETLISSALADGAGTVVATDGSRGSWGASAEQGLHQVNATEVAVVSTLGAGDVYHGALVSAVAFGLSLHESMRIATTVAARSCRALDGRSALPTREECQRYLRR